jgi:hypothetical protein
LWLNQACLGPALSRPLRKPFLLWGPTPSLKGRMSLIWPQSPQTHLVMSPFLQGLSQGARSWSVSDLSASMASLPSALRIFLWSVIGIGKGLALI